MPGRFLAREIRLVGLLGRCKSQNEKERANLRMVRGSNPGYRGMTLSKRFGSFGVV